MSSNILNSADLTLTEKVEMLLNKLENRYNAILYMPGCSGEASSLYFDINHIKKASQINPYTGKISPGNVSYLKSELARLGPEYLM